MNKQEWQARRRAYRKYLRECAERQVRVWMADSPSHAQQNDPRPAYVERPFGYSAPYDVMQQFGWQHYNMGVIGALVRRHQHRLGIAPTPVELSPGVFSKYSLDETKRRLYVRRLCEAVFERQLASPRSLPKVCVGHTHHHKPLPLAA